jgi:hypothetical protein
MERKIWIYGNPDKTDLGFPMPGDLSAYLRNDIFAKESGRYRYTQGKNADVIVLSRDGLAYGHFDIDDKVMPNDADRMAYPKVKYVYLVRKSSLYTQPVPLENLSISGLRFGKRISEATFQQLQQLAGGAAEFHKTPLLPTSVSELERVLREVQRRLGQSEFRKALIAAYGGKCAITGCNAVDALEAAHIVPYSEVGESDPANGLLLRADIHTLFDMHLLAIEPNSLTVVIADRLHHTSYAELAGKPVRIPESPALRLSATVLKGQWERFNPKEGMTVP